ncbi:centrosomal protein of 152 kDa isoform X2 [Nerophis ophidion]|uniref:centrosomal protein of 152 kDa isoform X2 n=1 Tax=Nerophis ophidion TaxID=159077 RepID=UPI002ADF3C46|nr:centrosomal protein of 152 kDa isoform X2 [Nerophis ophidion]
MAFFDGAPLQILQEEEEEGDDQADISRENELKKLLTDLPDDMLEDSREASFVEQETSTCNNKNAENSPQSKWIQQWSDHPRPTSHEQNYEAGYNQLPYGFDVNNVLGNNSHPHHAPMWNQQSKDPHFVQEDYTQTSIATEKSTEDSLFATDLTYEPDPHPQRVYNQVTCDRDGLSGNIHDNGDRHDPRMHFQAGATEQGVYPNTASYNPAHQKLNPQVQHQVGPFDQLQRELLDSTQQTAEKEQLAQLQILKKAQDKQIEGLEQKLEELRRSMRYLEHQHAIVKDERDGFAVKLNESSRLLDNAKDREAQMQNKMKVVEQDIQVLNRKDQENTEKQRVAEAAIDSMKQQMLCRSDTLSKASEKHDRDVAAIKEKHEAAVLTLQQKLDLLSKAMNEQVGSNHQLRDQVKQLERQREDEQLERARIVNALTQQLEESQQQSAKLLQNSPVHALSEIQIKLQQAHAAKVQSEEINRVLQEDLASMKEQITLYESAFKHGVIPLELTDDSENQLSDSCLALGLKKTKQKNGSLHSIVTANFSDSNLPKYETMREEMQHCLVVLQAKGQKISQLQEELQQSRVRVEELQTQLHEAKLRSVRESSQIKPTNLAEKDQNDLVQLTEDKQRLQDQVEALQKKTIELKQSEEKVKSAYSELCVKMKQMIQELDKEKQETAERAERLYQQRRDDAVDQIRKEHKSLIEQLTTQHEQHIQRLNTQLSETNDKMVSVQEQYISVCKEKDMLESVSSREQLEKNQREEIIKEVEKERAELEAQHQASIALLKCVWSKEKEVEIQQMVTSHVALAKVAWEEERQQVERMWTLRLEEATCVKRAVTSEVICQTDRIEADCLTITIEELNSRLAAQRLQLQLEADKVKQQAVDEARNQVQKDTQNQHLDNLSNKVEAAVARAYERWIEDLTSLPEFRACLQREKEKWEEQQKQDTKPKAMMEAEQLSHKNQQEQLQDQSWGAQRVAELQEEVVTLQRQLEQMNREQHALLKAELAGARAAWNRDKQQEISVVQARSEQVLQSRLQEQRKKLELALLNAKEEAEHRKKELFLQMEAKLHQTLRATEDEWRYQQAEKEHTQKRQIKEDFLAELQTSLGEVHTQLLGDFRTEALKQQNNEVITCSGASESAITDIIQTFCREIVDGAVSQAKKDWKKISEAQLSCVLRELQQQHEKELNEMQNSLTQMKGQTCNRKECTDTASELQKKNQELRKHLDKACRHLQHRVREHKTAMQKLEDEHESRLQKAEKEHLLQLEGVKKSKEDAGASDYQQSLQQSLEEMKQQYLKTVGKIRGDMLCYLQESRERAAEMIRTEVQRERQDTARKMRRYYLTCLHELLEDGGKTTGAENKIMNAASKLAAMAKVLETPIKNKSGNKHSLPASKTHFMNPSAQLCDRRPKEKTLDLEHQTTLTRTKLVSQQERNAPADAHVYPHKAPQVSSSGFAPLGSKSRVVYLQGGEPDNQLEVPVRDEKRSIWGLSSYDSDSLHIPPLSYSVSTGDASVLGEFGALTPVASDMTVYKKIAQKTPQTQTFASNAQMSSHREPTPGSEGEKQHGVCTRPLFSELRQRQQDSGFDSPFSQPK